MIDSDQLFKELLKTFFIEFLQLFFPEVLADMEVASLEFPDKEYFTELLTGERRTADIVAKAKFQGKESFFIIHVENQGDIKNQKTFQQREFFYAADLHRQTGLPVYSIAVLYGNKPKRPHQGVYRIQFGAHIALEFRYRVVQLNQLHWRDFVAHENPVAATLMAKMKIAPEERPIVKAACLSLLAGLELTEVERHLLSGFVDTYLSLNETEQKTFAQEIAKLKPARRKKTMELVTSWERKGKQEGLKLGESRGKQKEAVKLLLRLLRQRVGRVPADVQKQLEALPLAQVEKLFDKVMYVSTLDDAYSWFNKPS